MLHFDNGVINVNNAFDDSNKTIENLNMSNFYDFVIKYAKYTYELALKATRRPEDAEQLTINTLAHIVCFEAGDSAKRALTAEEVIKQVIKRPLSKQQIEDMYSEKVTFDIDKIYSTEIEDRILDEAVGKAQDEMPRYAPVFSGTSGTIMILSMVLFIALAIAFVWLDPLGKHLETEEVGGSDSVIASAGPVERLNSDLLIDIRSEVLYENEDGEAFTSGCAPVLFRIQGIDLDRIRDITVNDGSVPIYQYANGAFCFGANSNGIYKVTVLGAEDAKVTHYVTVNRLVVPDERIIADGYFAVSYGKETKVPFVAANGAFTQSAPSYSKRYATPTDDAVEVNGAGGMADVIITKEPKWCKAIKENGGVARIVSDKAGGKAGVDSISVSAVSSDGVQESYVVPLIIADSAPVILSKSLSLSVLHTPSRSGHTSGVISYTDADGDGVSVKLTETRGCSVMVSPSGRYIAKVSSDYAGSEAQFSVTVSDGLITSLPSVVHIRLENHLVSINELNREVTCYPGENGAKYDLDLPKTDLDGDPLVWSLVEPENGNARYGNVVINEQRSGAQFIVNPVQTEEFTQELLLTCSDGWITSDNIRVIISGKANRAPTLKGVLCEPAADSSYLCTLSLNNDCEFDTCTITSIAEVSGGTVKENEGWDKLQFTFTPDGTQDERFVRVVVTEKETGNTATLRCAIVAG